MCGGHCLGETEKGKRLGVLFGDVVFEDADGGGPFERSVESVVIVEVDETFIGAGALGV
jgi:hypothetical protein